MLVSRSPWAGRRVLVTGHTGFKGGWLSLWLNALGAEVAGFSLPPATEPNFFDQTHLRDLVAHREGDVRDLESVRTAVRDVRPEVVFHLAAQPLVRLSYDQPVETYATNVMGTVHLLEACRDAPDLQAVVCVTSDKCYENRESTTPYRESDQMGGHDPYSSSKGASEIVVSAYRRSFFQTGPRIASVRAGNVIGGGDWADDRLIPDIVRALLAGERPQIRNPNSIRPWQHVLDALSGYLLVAERLLEGRDDVACGWNFGPSDEDAQPVSWIVEKMLAEWGSDLAWQRPEGSQPHEAILLKLDCSKARNELGWRPKLRLGDALRNVVEWHKQVDGGADPRAVSLRQLAKYEGWNDSVIGQARAA
ncbi:MAG TPA: CDP-glucose 4,6-dehydratase [Sphingomicrobium sp.]